MQTYNILSSAIPNAPKIIPFPHPHCFYALSIFLLVLHFDGGFTNFYIFQQYFVVQKPNKVLKIDFQNLAKCLTKRSKTNPSTPSQTHTLQLLLYVSQLRCCSERKRALSTYYLVAFALCTTFNL